ncbi:efflux transporter outer membrane subunit [Dethiosulfatarculus sandiegensis]|nr:TolC family protein [Dethiosulfatarculus sandiegensis]
MAFQSTNKTGKPFLRDMGITVMISLLMMSGFLAGCSSKSAAIAPPLEVPAGFSRSGEVDLPDKWWLSFNDPVLNGLVEKALANNFDLKSAWDRLRQARALARSEGASLYPTLDLETGAGQSFNRKNGVSSDAQEFTLGLAAGYEVDLWGRIESKAAAADFTARASAEDLRAAAMSLSAEVAGVWYQLVEKNGQLDLLDKLISTNRQILELVEIQVRTGQVGISDMLQQQQLVESQKGEKALLSAQARVLEHQLAILLGSPPNQRVAPRVAALVDLPLLPKTGLPLELIRRRPDIKSAYYQIKAADKETAAAIANRFPRLSLTAGTSTTHENISGLFENWLATLAANLVAPLVDGGLREAEVERRRAILSEEINSYGQVIIDSLGEVEDALVRETRQQEAIASLEKQLELSQMVVRRLNDRYLQGTVDYQRVLDALISRQGLMQSLLSGKLNLLQYRIDLCRSLGGGWELSPPDSTRTLNREPMEKGDMFSGRESPVQYKTPKENNPETSGV